MTNKEKKRFVDHRIRFMEEVTPSLVLPYLPCMTDVSKERIARVEDREGAQRAAYELALQLVKKDDWYMNIINALRKTGKDSLADAIEGTDSQQNTGSDGASCARGSLDVASRSGTSSGGASPGRTSTYGTTGRTTSFEEASGDSPRSAWDGMGPAIRGGQTEAASNPTPAVSNKAQVIPHSTLIRKLPLHVNHVLESKLNREDLMYHDWRGLAAYIGFTSEVVQQIQSTQNPTEHLLKTWGQQRDATVGELLVYLARVERYDIISDLKENNIQFDHVEPDTSSCYQNKNSSSEELEAGVSAKPLHNSSDIGVMGSSGIKTETATGGKFPQQSMFKPHLTKCTPHLVKNDSFNLNDNKVSLISETTNGDSSESSQTSSVHNQEGFRRKANVDSTIGPSEPGSAVNKSKYMISSQQNGDHNIIESNWDNNSTPGNSSSKKCCSKNGVEEACSPSPRNKHVSTSCNQDRKKEPEDTGKKMIPQPISMRNPQHNAHLYNGEEAKIDPLSSEPLIANAPVNQQNPDDNLRTSILEYSDDETDEEESVGISNNCTAEASSNTAPNVVHLEILEQQMNTFDVLTLLKKKQVHSPMKQHTYANCRPANHMPIISGEQQAPPPIKSNLHLQISIESNTNSAEGQSDQNAVKAMQGAPLSDPTTCTGAQNSRETYQHPSSDALCESNNVKETAPQTYQHLSSDALCESNNAKETPLEIVESKKNNLEWVNSAEKSDATHAQETTRHSIIAKVGLISTTLSSMVANGIVW